MPKIEFLLPGDVSHLVEVAEGQSVLEAARLGDIDIEGACGGSMACATCHVIVAEDQFDALEPACDEEEDMLDLAESLQPTSRLGCQLCSRSDIDPLRVRVPQTSLLS